MDDQVDVTDYNMKGTNALQHTFRTIGVFWVNIYAENSVSSDIITLPEPIIVQHPVVGFELVVGELNSFVS